jgi:hypothetical protein
LDWPDSASPELPMLHRVAYNDGYNAKAAPFEWTKGCGSPDGPKSKVR